MSYINKLKYCIISCVQDDKFLEWLRTIENVPSEVQFYVLRNKPFEKPITIAAELDKFPNVHITMEPNSLYVNPDVEFGVKFVKLRYDSIRLAKPSEGDWIMLGDDDMFFQKGFDKVLENSLKTFEAIDYGIGTHRMLSSYSFANCKLEGLRHGIFFKYRKKIIDEFAAYQDTYGGGEDSLLHVLHYKAGVYKSCRLLLNKIDHVGGNMSRYFDKDMNTIKDLKYCVHHVYKLVEEIRNVKNFIKKQDKKSADFFKKLYKDFKLHIVFAETQEQKEAVEKYGFTYQLYSQKLTAGKVEVLYDLE
jgi:hypothetical protein